MLNSFEITDSFEITILDSFTANLLSEMWLFILVLLIVSIKE